MVGALCNTGAALSANPPPPPAVGVEGALGFMQDDTFIFIINHMISQLLGGKQELHMWFLCENQSYKVM